MDWKSYTMKGPNIWFDLDLFLGFGKGRDGKTENGGEGWRDEIN